MKKEHSFIAIAVIVVVAVVAMVFFGDSLGGPEYSTAYGACGGSCTADDGEGNSCTAGPCDNDERPVCNDDGDDVYCSCGPCSELDPRNLYVSTSCQGISHCVDEEVGCEATCGDGYMALCNGVCQCLSCDLSPVHDTTVQKGGT